MSGKFSGMRNAEAAETPSSDFFTRLRNVSMKPNASSIQMNAVPSDSLRSVCRPADETNFAKDFLKYRSKIQQVLNRSVVGVQDSAAVSLGNSSRNFAVLTSALNAAKNVNEEASFRRYPVSGGCGNISEGYSQAAYAPIQNTPIGNAPFQDSSDKNISDRDIPFQSSGQLSEEVLPYSGEKTAENAAKNSDNREVQSKKGGAIQLGNNPFAQLTAGTEKETHGKQGSAISSVEGWLSSIRCFGVLGLVSGMGLILYSLNAASGNHQMTELGISLLVSGISMFTAVGFFQAFRSAPAKVN